MKLIETIVGIGTFIAIVLFLIRTFFGLIFELIWNGLKFMAPIVIIGYIVLAIGSFLIQKQ